MGKPADVINELDDRQLDDVMRACGLLHDPLTRRIMAHLASNE